MLGLQIKKEYLGDGVYIDFKDSQIVLTTENGIEITNTIYLEPEVIVSLMDYLNKLSQQIEKVRNNYKNN